MKSFKIAGKFDGNEESLPKRDHPEGYVQFKEADMKKFAVIMNVMSAVVTAVCVLAFVLRLRSQIDMVMSLVGIILSLVALVPHEFLHGICMPGEVKMYTALDKGMLFVISIEDMSKARFVFMSLLPNIVFGFIPFTIAMICPQLSVLGFLGAFAIGGGCGDYYNVFNALTQVPKGAKIYNSGFHSFWYQPKEVK